MPSSRRKADRNAGTRLDLQHLAIFAMLGAVMFSSKLALEFLPNIHLLGMLTMVYTLVYRKYALIPICVNVLLIGIYAGFNAWWVPHLYLWTILWGVTMLLPQHTPRALRRLPQGWRKTGQLLLYATVCALHGFCYGTLYAPWQALAFHLNLKAMLAWIVVGLPWDLLHGVSNFCVGLLILPLTRLLRRLERGISK